jgi:hypothetical protein
MSISMEKFASEGHFATYNPFPPIMDRVSVFTLQCCSCGFEPHGAITAPRLCPKCHGNAFERYARPGSILENANRYD